MSSKARLKALAALVGFAVVVWLGMEWWLSRPVEEDFSAEVARITGDVPEAPVTVAQRDGPVKLAIGPLGLAGRGGDGAAADLLVAELSADAGFQFVERRDFARIMQEFELGAAGAIKPADAMKLGRLLGAEWFLLGSTYRSGTNASAVVRLVDARSGIVRDLLVLRGDGSPVDAAGSLAALLRRQRSGAESAGKLPEFVAVGGFEDLSVRPRHAGVEAELRNHLTATLAAGPMIVLERELTRLLLEEIRLQQAGLIESTNPPPRIQSTFWLVDGFWQSFDSVGDEIDLTLRVSRIGGAVGRKNVRANRGPALETAVASAMDGLLKQAQLAGVTRPATRKGEIRAQLARGMERAGITDQDFDSWNWGNWWHQRWTWDETTQAQRRENLLAAMQSFETVLLLDPGNSMARLGMARCLVDPAVSRPDEARDIYRELLNDPVGMVARTAMFSLGASYEAYGDFVRAEATYRSLEARAPASFRSRLRQNAEFAARRRGGEGDGPVDWVGREVAALRAVEKWRDEAKTRGAYSDSPVFSDFLAGDAEGKVARLARLEKLLPQLLDAVPEIEPHLLLLTVEHWAPTNYPFLDRLEASLATIRERPTALTAPGRYFSRLGFQGFGWAFDHKLNDLAARMADTVLAARQAGVKFNFEPPLQMKVALAYSYANRPRDAVAASALVQGEVVAMDSVGPWGGYPSWLMREALRRYNQKKLGEEPPADPLGFEPGQAVTIPAVWFLFAPETERLWLVNANRVWDFPLNGGPSVTNRLSASEQLVPEALQQTPEALWIGTDEGLFRFDKQTRQVRHWGRAEGLLLDEIRSLWLDDQRLWIGYKLLLRSERRWAGGVSLMTLSDARIRSFIPPLGESKDVPTDFDLLGTEPDWKLVPRRPVRAFARLGADEIVAAVEGVGLQRFNLPANEWSATPAKVRDTEIEVLATSADWLVSGEAPFHVKKDRKRPLAIFSHKSGDLHHFGTEQGLPFASVTTLALDGDRLWVGGPCYLLILDLPTRSIVRRCMMNNTAVHHLQIHGDDVWVRLNRAVYRFPRSLGGATR